MNFNKEEKESVKLLLQIFSHMHISFLLEKKDQISENVIYYLRLTSGHAKFDEDIRSSKPLFKITLSGNPILRIG